MTSPALATSSGDLIADRRYAIARDLERRGDLAAAADLLAQTLERAPDFSAAWFALGEIRERLGDRGGAREAFRRALALDPQDAPGAGAASGAARSAQRADAARLRAHAV